MVVMAIMAWYISGRLSGDTSHHQTACILGMLGLPFVSSDGTIQGPWDKNSTPTEIQWPATLMLSATLSTGGSWEVKHGCSCWLLHRGITTMNPCAGLTESRFINGEELGGTSENWSFPSSLVFPLLSHHQELLIC